MLDRVYRRNPDMVFRNIANELILVPIHHVAGEEDSIYVLSETGARVWELMNGIRTLSEIAACISSEFDIDSKQAAEDIAFYIEDMVEAGALEEA